MNTSTLESNENEDKFYACDRMYGEIIPTLRLTLEEIIKNELNKDFKGTGVYDFKGHAPENCPETILFSEGERVRDLEIFMEMMNKEFGSEYNCSKLADGRYCFDEFELFPDEEVDFEGAQIEHLKITRLTPGIDIGTGINAKKVEIRKIFCEKMPKNLTMETLVFDDLSDRAHPEERVSIPHNISVENMYIKSMHVTDVPADLNVNALFMNVETSCGYEVNPLENFKTFNNIVVSEFSSDAGMTKDLLSTITVKDLLVIPNYQSASLPEGIQTKSIDVSKSLIRLLPQNFKVQDMDISESLIVSIPEKFEVKDFFCAIDCAYLKKIHSGFKCSGTAQFQNTKIDALPSDMEVASLHLIGNKNLKEIPENINVEHLILGDFSGTVHYSEHYKSIKVQNCLPLIHPHIPNEIIRGATIEEIERSKVEYQRRENLKSIKRIQKERDVKS